MLQSHWSIRTKTQPSRTQHDVPKHDMVLEYTVYGWQEHAQCCTGTYVSIHAVTPKDKGKKGKNKEKTKQIISLVAVDHHRQKTSSILYRIIWREPGDTCDEISGG